MGKTSIEWTDASWNPIVGCTEVSPGCANCYAARLAASRLRSVKQYAGLTVIQDGDRGPASLPRHPRWTGEVRFLPERLEEPLRWKKPRRIFVCDMGGPFWVICGGESGPNARPMHPDWARSLRDQCVSAGVPFFFKQWGEWIPNAQIRECSTKRYEVRQFENLSFDRVGKKLAGRLLDGRTWDEFPTVAAGGSPVVTGAKENVKP